MVPVVPGLYNQFLPQGLQGKARDFFCYGITQTPIAAGGAVAPSFTIDSDSAFLLTAINGTARDPAAPTVRFLAPALTLEILSQGAGRLLANQPLHWDTWVGDAQLPGILPYPKYI